jgi:hypothetical protein
MVAPLQGLTRYSYFPGFHPGLSHSVPSELNCERTIQDVYNRHAYGPGNIQSAVGANCPEHPETTFRDC